MTWRRCVGIVVAISVPVMASAQDYGYTQGADSGTLYRVAIPSGSMESVGDSGGDLGSFALSAGGQLFGLSSDGLELYLVDTVTGEATNLGTIAVEPDQFPTSLTFDQNGRLLLLANAHPQSALYEIDPTSATADFVVWIDSDMVTSIAISGTACYAASPWGKLYSVNLSTGDVSELPGFSGGYFRMVHDLSFDGGGQLWAAEEQTDPVSGCAANYLARFDLATGEYVRVARLSVPGYECLYPLAIQSVRELPVPAQGPAGLTVLVLLIAALGVGILMSRR